MEYAVIFPICLLASAYYLESVPESVQKLGEVG